MRIAVIVASLGRPTVLADLLENLESQTRRPDIVAICITTPDDAPPARACADHRGRLNVEVLICAKGSCAQRNAGVSTVAGDADIIVYFDDDFVPAADYLANLEALFETRADLAGVTGVVLADGAVGPGLSLEKARAVIAGHGGAAETANREEIVPNLYGCNMAFRASAVEGLRFDERLPLYGWLEDVDYSALAGRNGALIRSGRLKGVHLGVKKGRTSGVRFGYSQIVNPVYLLRKKTIGYGQAFANIFRTAAANHLKMFAPEPYVDRWGRVKGNWIAVGDLLGGRITPERILDLG